jgi:putative oxidoreductase
MQYSVLLGRFFYSLIFIFAALGHFSQQTIGYAASQGVPMANVLVPFSGIMALVGGLSILLGYKSRWGAVLIILFLIPVTISMHNFWAVIDDPAFWYRTIKFGER